MPRVAIGACRHVVTFETPSGTVPDGEGGYTEGWAPIPPGVWRVSIRPATVRDLERATAGTVTAHATHIVEGRYCAGVTTKTRIRWEDFAPDGTSRTRLLSVNGVQNVDERDVDMALFCEELVDPGAV